MSAPPAADPTSRLKAWLDVASSGQPTASADSETVWFVSDASGFPSLWAVPSAGGEATPWGTGDRRVQEPLASPSGSKVLVKLDRGGDERWQLAVLSAPETGAAGIARVDELTAEPARIHDSCRWAPAGDGVYFTSNERDPRFFDLYHVGLDSDRKPRRLLEVDGWLSVADVRGDRLLATLHRTNLDVDLRLFSGDSWTHLNPHEGEETVYSASLGTDAVYAGANPGREFAALVRYRPGVGHAEILHEYPGDVELVEASPDGRTLVVGVNRSGWSDLHLFDVSTQEDRVFRSGPRGVTSSVSWYPDGSAFAFDLSNVQGSEVWRRLVDSGKERRLTRLGPAAPAARPEPKLAQFRASDGVPIAYWEFPSVGRSVGTVVVVHGGPEAQARPRFDAIVGFLNHEGFRVIEPNVRGSTGYGRTFVHLDDVRRRMDSVRDLDELAGRLADEGPAPGPISVVGGSYGGFMVLAALTTYPERFAAGVDIVGIANFVTFLEETGPWRRRIREAEYGSLDRDREFLAEISPIHHADRIRAPLLIIHGRNDPRVPLHEAEQIAATLTSRGGSVDLLVFDDEGHGIVRRPNRVVAWSRAAEFLHRARSPHPSPGGEVLPSR